LEKLVFYSNSELLGGKLTLTQPKTRQGANRQPLSVGRFDLITLWYENLYSVSYFA